MQLSPFVKGALGFVGCAGVCAIAYKIGKSVGREETLREVDIVEREEKFAQAQVQQKMIIQEAPPVKSDISSASAIIPIPETPEVIVPDQSTAEKIRKMHGWRGTIFGGTSVIKDLLRNPDGKKLVLTVEDGDVVARISQKEG